jgi:hypothetical protein
MATIKPLRQYSESDVINLFSFNGASANKGAIVKLATASGWRSSDETLAMGGSVGSPFSNTVSQRYATAAKVSLANSGDVPIGMLLMDVKETDENGEKLVFNPRKAAEMGVVVSGQVVPILTRGIVLYSGASLAAENPPAGTIVYAGDNGELTALAAGKKTVGRTLGSKDSNDHILLKIEI